MPENLSQKIGAALGEGYSASEVLDHITPNLGADKVQAARQAGYSDEDILKHLSGTGATAQPTSLTDAAIMSTQYQVPAMLERGAGGLLNRAGVAPDLAKGLIDRAAGNEQAYNQQYVPDPSVPNSVGEAISGASGPLDAAARVGQRVVRGTAENVGPVAGGLATAGLTGLALAGGGWLPAAAAGASIGVNSLMNLGGNLQDKAAHGLDGTTASNTDLVNTGLQTALEAVPVPGGGGVVAQLGKQFVGNAAKGATQQAMTSIGTAMQGGQFGPDPALEIASSALDAGLIGGAMGTGMHATGKALGAAVAVPARAMEAHKAGENVRAFSAETSDWNAAVAQASETLRQASPDMPPEEVRSRAYQEAQKAGVEPPTFDRLSPEAQNGAAELAAVQMYDAALKTVTEGMGRPNYKPEPPLVFKTMMRSIDANLRRIAGGLAQNGLITKEDASNLFGAITEAQRHNHAAGENGRQYSFFDTFRDHVAALGIDPAIRNTVLMQLRVLDLASSNGLKQNSKGPLERHAGKILPIIGAGMAGLTSGVSLLEGGLAGKLFQGAGTATLRSFDRLMRTQQPDLLRRRGAIEGYAERNNLEPGTTPGDLMSIQEQLAELRRPITPPPTAPAGPEPGPVTSDPARFAAGVRQPMTADPTQALGGPRVVPGRPAAAPAEAPTGPAAAPAPSVPANGPKAVQALLEARAAQFGEQARTAFPADAGGGWSRAIASTLGVPHTEVRRIVDEARARGELSPELHALLSQDQPIPRAVMEALTNHIADLRDRGLVAGRAEPTTRVNGEGRSVRDDMRLASYEASIGQARDAANNVRTNHPELAPVVARVEAESHVLDKQAEVDKFLATIPDAGTRQTFGDILNPLAQFGDKKPKGPPTPPTTPPGPRGGGGGPRGGGGRPPSDPLFGSDPGRRGRSVAGPSTPGDLPGSKRNKVESAARADRPAPGGAIKAQPGDFREGANPKEFHDAIKAAKDANPHGSSVELKDLEEYGHTRNFLTADGKAGFALKGQDIVSVFKHPDSPHKGVADAALKRGVSEGGRTLDAFDTELPHLYGRNGFRAVARMPFNEEYAPEGWDYGHYAAYNNGRPDVVFMAHDPAHGKPYQAGDGPTVSEWDHGVEAQQKALANPSSAEVVPLRAQQRLQAEQRANDAQARASTLWDKLKLSKGEQAVLIPKELDALEAGGKAARRGRNGIDVSNDELLPARAKAKVPVMTGMDKETSGKVADMIYKEALYHLSRSNSAVGWYEGKLNTAMDMLAQNYPELKSNPHAATAFKTILAITSNGNPVVTNFRQTQEIYDQIRDRVAKGDYTLPTDTNLNDKAAMMNKSFGAWNAGVKAMGIEEFSRFLRTKLTAKELSDAWEKATGSPVKISGESVNAPTYGAAIFGPKIGNGFFANLHGHFEMPTMDRWFMRTIGRLTGELVVKPDAAAQDKQAAKLVAALRGTNGLEAVGDLGDHRISPETEARAAEGDHKALMDVAQALWTVDNRQGFPRTGNGKLVDGSPISPASDALRKASKAFLRGSEGQMLQQPKGAAHRTFLRGVMDEAVAKLNKAGIPITHADLQAVMWFPEQRYWQQRLGVGSGKTDADYEDAAVISLMNRGNEDAIRRVYADQGFNPTEIDAKIAARRTLAQKVAKDPAPRLEEDTSDE